MVVAVISDTHLPRRARRLPDACVQRMRESDLIVHAGDFVASDVLRELRALGPPLAAVHGNVDDAEVSRLLPQTAVVHAADAKIGLIHDAGPAHGRLGRMRARFPEADVVVFGHSHIPLHEERDGFHIFNPGSPTDRRRQPRHTMGLLHVDGGVTCEIIELD